MADHFQLNKVKTMDVNKNDITNMFHLFFQLSRIDSYGNNSCIDSYGINSCVDSYGINSHAWTPT